jgi:GH43 family beta-xylosidase
MKIITKSVIHRSISWALVLVASLTLMACGGGSSGSSTPANSTSSAAVTSSQSTLASSSSLVASSAVSSSLQATSSSSISSSVSSSSSSSSSVSSSSSNSSIALTEGQFLNPLYTNGADPWLQFYKGNYYLTTTTWNSQIVMRKSPTLAGLAKATQVTVWSETAADRCCAFWAFEFHRLMGPNGYRWYMMYSAGNAKDLGGQRLRVLESASDDPMGPYTYKATPMPAVWNIDGTYFQNKNDLYVIWSEFSGAFQSLWIAKMENPWTISGDKHIISIPNLAWEQIDGNVNEGPVILQHDGRTFLIHSASGCGTQDYKLGQLELTGSDPLQASSWLKTMVPVFQKTSTVFGPGHNGFFKSPDDTENWIVYHANAKSTQGCGDTRAVRAQKFNWNDDGTPTFGEPAAPTQVMNPPSGEAGPLTVKPEGAAYQLVNRRSGLCLSVADSGGNLVQRDCEATSSQWVLDYTTEGAYRFANIQTKTMAEIASCNVSDGAGASAWTNNACQKWIVEKSLDGWLKFKNMGSKKFMDVSGCSTAALGAVAQSATSDCQEWRLQPVGTVAIMSAVSGKAVEVANCSAADAANIDQFEWQNTQCQKWVFKHADNGYYTVSPTHNPSACMGVVNASLAAGGNIAQVSCSGTNSQWRFEPLLDGTFKFVARHSDLVIDVAACGIANSTNIAQYTWLNNICQRFQIRAAN